MRSREILLIFSSGLLVTAATAEESVSVDASLCLTCEDVVPSSIRTKALGGRNAEPSEPKTCRALCVFSGKPRVVVGADCGKEAEARRHEALPSGTRPLADLEDMGHTAVSQDEFFLGFSDKDTPCTVRIHWEGGSEGHCAGSGCRQGAHARGGRKEKEYRGRHLGARRDRRTRQGSAGRVG